MTTSIQKLSTLQTCLKLQTLDISLIPPVRNKGERGQLLENLLGIANSSELIDLIDGELKTFTIGESIAVTQLQHCLPEIIEHSVPFDESLVATKLSQVIYVGFDKAKGFCKGFKLINRMLEPEHYLMLQQDYKSITEKIRTAYEKKQELSTINGDNDILQIRTKASKRKDGTYTPLIYKGVTVKNKGMAFYLKASFGKQLFI